MKGIVQKKQAGCDGCLFEGNDNIECLLQDVNDNMSIWQSGDEFMNCGLHNCIYVIADVEPVNKDGE